MFTSEQLDALQTAAEAATAGPWTRFDPSEEECHALVGPIGDRDNLVVYAECDPTDAAFIAAANPAVILELVAAHRAALSRTARVEALHQRIGASWPHNGGVYVCQADGGIWPCSTVRALTEGEPSE